VVVQASAADGGSGPVPTGSRRASDLELPDLFTAAFTQSRNAMLLVDEHRRIVDANGAYLALLGAVRGEIIGRHVWEYVVGGPLRTARQWQAHLNQGRFTGTAELKGAGDGPILVQWAATTERVTGRYLVLFVALSTSRWGTQFRREATNAKPPEPSALSARELEVVRMVAFGSTGPEIADELRISHHTVRTHVRNAMAKVDARSRAHLVAKALGDGLVLD
jgi:DNA-binding CsgD family transcriptional regulator